MEHPRITAHYRNHERVISTLPGSYNVLADVDFGTHKEFAWDKVVKQISELENALAAQHDKIDMMLNTPKNANPIVHCMETHKERLFVGTNVGLFIVKNQKLVPFPETEKEDS